MDGRHAGFTPIEAAATVAAVALALALGLPALAGTLERQRRAGVLHLVAQDLAAARSAAILRREPVMVCPGGPQGGCVQGRDWSHGWMVFVAPAGNGRPDAAADVLQVRGPEAAAARFSLGSTRPSLRYQPNGVTGREALSVDACAGRRLRGSVVVSRLGRVRTELRRGRARCPDFGGIRP
ncbi:MAG: hypothetical protein GX856_08340 [Gammaproteobacteria bacterium]|nr:hypothetical protein [Gammaproteobacteria bacterium]